MTDGTRRHNLVLRAISGAVVVSVILGGIHQGGWVWFSVVMALAITSLSEYYRLLSTQFKLSRGIGYLSAIAVIFSSAEGVKPDFVAIIILCLTVYAILMVEILRRQTWGASFAILNTGGILSGLFFVIVPWSILISMRNMPTGRLYLISLFACTWSCDVTAFLVGTKWGRIRLCEKISPKKTWEGAIGGALGSVLMIALIIFYYEQPPYPLLLIGFICAFAGQFGDLAESLIKRETGVADSGNLIPGHGGVLDRFDSILINGILTYLVFGVYLA